MLKVLINIYHKQYVYITYIKKESHRLSFYYFCLQTWLPTVQHVLQADWQEVWHSPQPPVLAVFCKDSVLIVRIRLAMIILLNTYCITVILS